MGEKRSRNRCAQSVRLKLFPLSEREIISYALSRRDLGLLSRTPQKYVTMNAVVWQSNPPFVAH